MTPQTASCGWGILCPARPARVSGNGVTRDPPVSRKVQGRRRKPAILSRTARRQVSIGSQTRLTRKRRQGSAEERGHRSGGNPFPPATGRCGDAEVWFKGCVSEPLRSAARSARFGRSWKGSTQSAGLFRQLRVCAFRGTLQASSRARIAATMRGRSSGTGTKRSGSGAPSRHAWPPSSSRRTTAPGSRGG
jgi:hypothetical protein